MLRRISSRNAGEGWLPPISSMPHADARERRAQLVRGIGQQRFVRLHQGLDARGRSVELAREVGHLVVAVHRHARRQIALAKALHAVLQHIEPLEQPPDDREHAQATARPTRPSIQTKPNGGRVQKAASARPRERSPRLARGAICRL